MYPSPLYLQHLAQYLGHTRYLPKTLDLNKILNWKYKRLNVGTLFLDKKKITLNADLGTNIETFIIANIS